MKHNRILLAFFFTITLAGLEASPETEAARRAGELARLFATQSSEPQWLEKIIPEYWHPLGNDSGLPARYPDFIPDIDTTQGTFLFSQFVIGQVVSGTSPWILEGRETVYCVELIYSIVASVDTVVTIYDRPKKRSEYYVMAMDKRDAKWKFIQAYPYRAGFYEISYFLKSWEKILGKGSVKNIPEVKQVLLDLVRK